MIPSHRESGRHATRETGFTLVELLVVVAIIGLLAAMLLTSLSRAKGTSVRAKCMNHQRQVFLAMRMFADENNDTLPPREDPYWVAQLHSYYRNPLVLVCPADPSRTGVAPDSIVTNFLNASSYILNVFNYYASDGVTVIDDDGTVRADGQTVVDFRRIASPSTAILLAEKIDYSASNNSYYMDFAGNDQQNKVHYFRHEDGSNFTFTDGHQEFLRKVSVTTPHNLWTAMTRD